MAGLYVPLDVEYANDPKMIDAGPMAELLYVRGLCFAKRSMKDGFIARSQLPVISVGIPRPTVHATRLVEVGAWDEAVGGWQIAGWLKRNKPAAQIKADREARALKSAMGNHERWHVKEDKFDPTCRFCNPYPDPTGDPHDDPRSDPRSDPKRRESQRESESESEREREREVATSRSTDTPPARTAKRPVDNPTPIGEFARRAIGKGGR